MGYRLSSGPAANRAKILGNHMATNPPFLLRRRHDHRAVAKPQLPSVTVASLWERRAKPFGDVALERIELP
jgi:hypothetical protein